jgi:hypothetical protein
MMTRIPRSKVRTKKDGLRKHTVLSPGKGGFWRGLILLVVCCSCNSVGSHAASVKHKHRNMQENEGPGYRDPNSAWQSTPTCPTGEPRTVVINTSTGEWGFLEMNNDDNDNDDDVVGIRDNNEGLLSNDFNSRRMLRTGSDALASRLFPVDPLLMGGDGDADYFHRAMLTDGSNSLATEDETTITIQARPCACYQNNGVGNNRTEVNFVTLCPEVSDWCDFDGARCYRVGQIDVIARNIWPLLWMWYCTILLGICCTFQGRIVLDFVKGTILYYFCGCGDRFANREMRNIDRYNHWIVEEIVNEEHIDRDEVRTARNNGSAAGRQMNAIANRNINIIIETDGDAEEQEQGVPPMIVTSTSFPAGGNENDNDIDSDSDDETEPTPSLTSRLAERFRNVVWPWQTSWKRYIKYNLLIRVEWIAMREEVDFIESRQERGLPHARYEMKTRRWNAETEGCCGSVGDPSGSLANSVDEPHCTICFSELEDGDKIGDIGCRHVFHADCLKMWVTKRNSCPLCNIPVARRKRILSEELIKEDLLRQKSSAEAEAAAETHHSNVYGSGANLDFNNNTTMDSSSSDYDHTLPPVEGYYGSPSHQQRRGPRRLSHTPMTPSTVAADTYSNYSDDIFDHLEAVDMGREASPSSQNEHEVDRNPTATSTSTSTSTTNPPSVLLATATIPTTTAGRISRISEIHARISEIQEDVDESDHASSSNLDDMGCNINDYLSRDNKRSQNNQPSSLNSSLTEDDENCAVDIPSPPRRIRRRADENDDEVTCGVFAPTTEDDDDHLPALENNDNNNTSLLSLGLVPERDELQTKDQSEEEEQGPGDSGSSTDPQ